METRIGRIGWLWVAVALVLAAVLLAGCGGGAQSGARSGASGGEAAPSEGAVREQIESKLADMRANSYDNASFTMQTDTSVTGRDEGRVVQQGMQATMRGEISRAEGNQAMHFSYEMRSSTSAENLVYDMYVNKDGVMVKQNGQFFRNAADGATPEEYIASVADVASEENVAKLLNAATASSLDYDADGNASINITVDVSKLEGDDMIDASSLPEGTEVATLVANYVISADNWLESARIASSTAGSPTYRVNQAYKFSKYNETELPEFPSMADQLASDPRVTVDEHGDMWFTAEDGNRYLIESIDEDGTVHFSGGTASGGGGGGGYYDAGGYYGGGGGYDTGGGGGGGGGYATGGGGGSPNIEGGAGTATGSPQISGGDTGGDTGMGDPIISE